MVFHQLRQEVQTNSEKQEKTGGGRCQITCCWLHVWTGVSTCVSVRVRMVVWTVLRFDLCPVPGPYGSAMCHLCTWPWNNAHSSLLLPHLCRPRLRVQLRKQSINSKLEHTKFPRYCESLYVCIQNLCLLNSKLYVCIQNLCLLNSIALCLIYHCLTSSIWMVPHVLYAGLKGTGNLCSVFGTLL